MASACERETMHSPGSQRQYTYVPGSFHLSINSGSLWSGEAIVMLECNSKHIQTLKSRVRIIYLPQIIFGQLFGIKKYWNHIHTNGLARDRGGTLGQIRDNKIKTGYCILQTRITWDEMEITHRKHHARNKWRGEVRRVFVVFLWVCWSRPTPADAVVVEVFAAFWAKHLHHHTVEVEALHQHPGEGAQEEEV